MDHKIFWKEIKGKVFKIKFELAEYFKLKYFEKFIFVTKFFFQFGLMFQDVMQS